MNGTSYEVRLKNGDENEIRPDCFMREKLKISKFVIQVILIFLSAGELMHSFTFKHNCIDFCK